MVTYGMGYNRWNYSSSILFKSVNFPI